MIIFLIIQISKQLIVDDTKIYRYSHQLQISLPTAINAELIPNNEQCQLYKPIIQNNLDQLKIIEDNVINIDFMDETQFYFHQFIAIIKKNDTQFLIISDNLKLYYIDAYQRKTIDIINLSDYLSKDFDVSFFKDKFNNIFIHQQDSILLISNRSIIPYFLINRGQRYQTIYHLNNYIITAVGSYGFDIYEILYNYPNQEISIKFHSNTVHLHLHPIGICYNKIQPNQLFILDQKLGLIVAEMNEKGSISLDSQHPLDFINPDKIQSTNKFIYISSNVQLNKYDILTYKLISIQKLKNIQKLQTSENQDEIVVLGFNKHYIEDMEWKFIGLHDLILNDNKLIAVTGTNFYIGNIIKLPFRILCSHVQNSEQQQFTLFYNTTYEQHVQQLIVQRIDIDQYNPIIQLLLSFCFVLIILLLFVCLYINKLRSIHLQHERIRKKLENQQHTRITMNSQMY
ncbi:unnamed protein product [Paramecium primaurelia]|uniref:Transmembrane protein n=1 Tax=Paramecium primaurelia TaxID=5886 RepID=A0A8S1NQ13_PARPR|nr:unnamed protein product [Paramecium primaurelia]